MSSGTALLVRLGDCEENNDGANPGEECEEPEDPTPVHASNGHEPRDQGGNLPSTRSGRNALKTKCFWQLTVGPAHGAIAKNDRALPRSSGAHRSPRRALQWSFQPKVQAENDRHLPGVG